MAAMLAIGVVAAAAAAQTTRPERERDPRLVVAWERASSVMQSRYYVIRSDLDGETTRLLGEHLDRLCDEYARVLAGLQQRRTGRRLQVFLFRTREAYLATLALRFDAEPEGTGGMAIRDGTEITLAAWQGDRGVAELEAVLRHEGFHQYREIFFPSMPPWVNEGLAEVFEHAVVLEDGFLLGEVNPGQLRVLREAAQQNRLIPFDRLFKMDADDWQDHVNAGRGGLQYAQAWSIVHYLVYGEGGRFVPTFERFLVLMNRGLSWEAAFQHAFGMQDLGPFARRWLAYVSTLQATDLAETVARLEYLAAGHAGLADEGAEPDTFDDLRAALEAAEFRHETGRFGVTRRLSFEDPSVFTPAGEAAEAGKARFVLEDNRPDGRRGAGRSGTREGDTALPERAVFTRGLFPVDLGIVWTIDRRGGDRGWRLVSELSRPAAEPDNESK